MRNKPFCELSYHINLDERGSFCADVRRDGKTILDIKAGNELEEDETSIFEDGFMVSKTDLVGLGDYLKHLGLAKTGETIDFEEKGVWWEIQ